MIKSKIGKLVIIWTLFWIFVPYSLKIKVFAVNFIQQFFKSSDSNIFDLRLLSVLLLSYTIFNSFISFNTAYMSIKQCFLISGTLQNLKKLKQAFLILDKAIDAEE